MLPGAGQMKDVISQIDDKQLDRVHHLDRRAARAEVRSQLDRAAGVRGRHEARAGRVDREGLLLAERRRHLGLGRGVHPRGAAASVAVGNLDERKPGDLGEDRAERGQRHPKDDHVRSSTERRVRAEIRGRAMELPEGSRGARSGAMFRDRISQRGRAVAAKVAEMARERGMSARPDSIAVKPSWTIGCWISRRLNSKLWCTLFNMPNVW